MIEISQRILGTEHPDTLKSMNNLALTYWSQGRQPEAEEMMAQVLKIRKRTLGTEHPDTLASMNNISIIQKGGQYNLIFKLFNSYWSQI